MATWLEHRTVNRENPGSNIVLLTLEQFRLFYVKIDCLCMNYYLAVNSGLVEICHPAFIDRMLLTEVEVLSV